MANKVSNAELRAEILRADKKKDVHFCGAVAIAVFAGISSGAGVLAVLAMGFLENFRHDVIMLWLTCVPFCFPIITGLSVAYRKQLATVGVHIALVLATTGAGGAGYGLSIEKVYIDRHNCTHVDLEDRGSCDREILVYLYVISGGVAAGFAILGLLISFCACSNASKRRNRRLEAEAVLHLKREEDETRRRQMASKTILMAASASTVKTPALNGTATINGSATKMGSPIVAAPLQTILEAPKKEVNDPIVPLQFSAPVIASTNPYAMQLGAPAQASPQLQAAPPMTTHPHLAPAAQVSQMTAPDPVVAQQAPATIATAPEAPTFASPESPHSAGTENTIPSQIPQPAQISPCVPQYVPLAHQQVPAAQQLTQSVISAPTALQPASQPQVHTELAVQTSPIASALPFIQAPEMKPTGQIPQMAPVDSTMQPLHATLMSQMYPVAQVSQMTPVAHFQHMMPTIQAPQMTTIAQMPQQYSVSQVQQMTPIQQVPQPSPGQPPSTATTATQTSNEPQVLTAKPMLNGFSSEHQVSTVSTHL